MSPSVRASMLTTAGVLLATAAGLYLSAHRATTSSVAPVSAAASPVVTGVQPAAPVAPTPDAGATLQWPGIIAVDPSTGQLRSDLGWRNGTKGEVAAVLHCEVATETAPRWRRVLVAPSLTIVSPAWVSADCAAGFHQWDSAETVSNGKWPAVSAASGASSVTGAVLQDAAWRDGLSVREARAVVGNEKTKD